MIRRDFLSLSALTAGGLMLNPWTRAFAQNAQRARHRFILINIDSGWDVTLGIAPLTHADWGTDHQDVFIEYRDDERLSAGGVLLGPAAAPLLPYAGRFSVVNGLFLSRNDPGHESASVYMRTGDGTGARGDLPVEIAAQDADAGLGVLFNSRLSRGSAKVMSLQLSEMDTLVELGRIGLSPGDCSRPLTDFARARCELESKKQQLDEYARIYDLLTAGRNGGPELNPARIAAVLGSGLSRFVRWDISKSLDTHINHVGTHLEQQKLAWTDVAALFDALIKTPIEGGRCLFDDTTVLVVSEFARTPALNGSGGKDHNPLLNGVLIAGAGIKGGLSLGRGRVIGRKISPSGLPSHVGLPMDFATGEVAVTRAQAADPRFRFITPDIIGETVRQALGVPADSKKLISALL